MHRGGEKFKLFSAGSGFTGQFFTGELSGVDSVAALKQAVKILPIFVVLVEKRTVALNPEDFHRKKLSHR